MDPQQQQQPIRVVFALLPGSLVLDWAGPAEALRIANQRLQAAGQPERFAIEFASPRPTSIASVGVALAGLAPLPTQWDGPAWVVLVGLPGNTIAIDSGTTAMQLAEANFWSPASDLTITAQMSQSRLLPTVKTA